MERLRQYLDDQQLTQTQLAERIGVSQPTVWGWLNGEYSPSVESLRALSKVTGLSIDDLLDRPSRSFRAAG